MSGSGGGCFVLVSGIFFHVERVLFGCLTDRSRVVEALGLKFTGFVGKGVVVIWIAEFGNFIWCSLCLVLKFGSFLFWKERIGGFIWTHGGSLDVWFCCGQGGVCWWCL